MLLQFLQSLKNNGYFFVEEQQNETRYVTVEPCSSLQFNFIFSKYVNWFGITRKLPREVKISYQNNKTFIESPQCLRGSNTLVSVEEKTLIIENYQVSNDQESKIKYFVEYPYDSLIMFDLTKFTRDERVLQYFRTNPFVITFP